MVICRRAVEAKSLSGLSQCTNLVTHFYKVTVSYDFPYLTKFIITKRPLFIGTKNLLYKTLIVYQTKVKSK